jgi:hypothetical protein
VLTNPGPAARGAGTRGDGSFGARSTRDAAGPVALSVNKSWNGSSWELGLSWSGHTGDTTITYSTDPAFEQSVKTLEMGYADPTLTLEARDDRTLECFDVTDATTASRAIQGLGYDPSPEPGKATLQEGRRSPIWWWSDVTVNSKYLSPMAKANSLGMQNLTMRAHQVGPETNGFVQQATFLVPEDARSFWMVPQANGRGAREATFVTLEPPGVGPYTNIRGIDWDPVSGHIWVAADGRVDEIDIFHIIPTVETSFTDASKPYISRITSDGRLLYVNGVAGVTQIYEVDVTTGGRTVYASTTDTYFTRPITPVGIAAAIDGSAAYIADASTGTIVRFPEYNSTDITDDWGNWPYWGFADPAGMETTPNGSVLVGAVNNWVGIIPDASTTWWAFDTHAPVKNLALDRDVTPDWGYLVFWSEHPAYAEAYNRNPLSTVTGQPVRNVGALIVSEGDDKIAVSPNWNYMPAGRHVVWPVRVVLNRAGHNYAFPWKHQVADRLVKLEIEGWNNVPLHLRLIDPPDFSPYIQDGGTGPKPGKTAYPPYEANDNEIWTDGTYTDFGLTTDPGGTIVGGPVLELDVVPDSSHFAVVYLKLPERYAGDNWRVEVTKKSYYGVPVPNKVPGYSTIYTGWKRMHVERERMFVTGGVLSRDAAVGAQEIYLAKIQHDGTWHQADNLSDGTKVVIIDSAHRFDRPDHDEACIKTITSISDFERKAVLADKSDCTSAYSLKYAYSSSVVAATHQWTFAAGTRGAGVGSVDICSTAPNKLNTIDSCFFAPDLRRVEQPFNDVYVEIMAPRTHMSDLPYLPKWFFDDSTSLDLLRCSQIWFGHFTPKPGSGTPPEAERHNYFQMLGARDTTDTSGGITYEDHDFSVVYIGKIQDLPLTPPQIVNVMGSTTSHELAHLLEVNPDECSGHDTRNAWCSTTGCPAEKCLMDTGRDRLNGVDRFCMQDILTGAPAPTGGETCDGSPLVWVQGEGAIRTDEDPQ